VALKSLLRRTPARVWPESQAGDGRTGPPARRGSGALVGDGL